MKISVIDPKEDARWDEFVLNHKFGSIYSLSDWSEILKKSFGYQPNYIISEENGAIKAAIPLMLVKSWLTGKRLVSLPRIPYCDPLVTWGDELKGMLEYIYQIVDESQIQYVEIKTQFNNQLFKDNQLKSYQHFRNHLLSLENDRDGLWKSFDRTCVRQRISRAQRDNVKFRLGETDEDLKIFYSLHKMTAAKQKIPVRPFIYFYNIWETLRKKNLILLLIAEVNGEAGAANISFKYKNTLYFEYLGLNNDLIKHSSGHLLIWEAIKIACDNNFQYFDFGLTPPDNPGLADFKRRWGAIESELSYFYYPDVKGYKNFIKKFSVQSASRDSVTETYKKKIKRHVAGKLFKHFG